MSDNHSEAVQNGTKLWIDGHPIEPDSNIKILGSLVSCDASERVTYLHRIKQAWKTYFVWKRVLESKTAVCSRLEVWKATVMRSLLWGLETTRHNKKLVGLLITTQKNMIRKMMGLKRKPLSVPSDNTPLILESWVDWQIRSLHSAGQVIRKNNASIDTFLNNSRISWAHHLGRFGVGPRSEHLVKKVILWRNLGWWQLQKQYNDMGLHPCRHPKTGKLRRFEESLPVNWLVDSLSSAS